MSSRKDHRQSILDGIAEAWDLMPEMPFGSVVHYIMEAEDPREVGDEELLVYVNDFVLNNM